MLGAVEVDRNGLEVLGHEECLLLLRRSTLGRIGVTMGALPVVLPVNFWCDGDRILIRTSAGSKLDAALCGAVVAFEVDDLDPLYHSGWSVMVTGVAHEITDPAQLQDLAAAPLARWAPRGQEHVMVIATDVISGRRIVEGRSTSEGARTPAPR